jgi:hypothetical protein
VVFVLEPFGGEQAHQVMEAVPAVGGGQQQSEIGRRR